MKTLLPAILVLLSAATFTHCAETKFNDKPLTEVRKEIEDGKAVLVDCREQTEWDAGHLQAATKLPLSALKNDPKATSALPKDKTIYLHCKSGGRAFTAADMLNTQGYHAIAIKEGVEALEKSGFAPGK